MTSSARRSQAVTHPLAGRDSDARAGARNLLVDCLGLVTGDRLLIVAEQPDVARSHPEVCHFIASEAEALGLVTEIVVAPPTTCANDCPTEIATAIGEADGTVFLGILGDQLRFVPLPGKGRKAVCYLPDAEYLADPFARAPYRLFTDVEARISRLFETARHYRMTCPLGTELEADMPEDRPDGGARQIPFSVSLFPAMIFPPVTCSGLAGRLALSNWLTSSSTNTFEDSVLRIDEQVMGEVRDGRLVDFSGPASEVAKVRRHFERVGQLIGGDPFAVNSWHTGINPRTFYRGNPMDDIERWGDIAYGSPRFTHFHACGAEPGDIAISVFDATIVVDGETLWRDGNFAFLDRPEQRQLLAVYPGQEQAFEMRRDIGI